MYRSRALTFLLAMVLVFGLGASAYATVYNWNADASIDYRTPSVWRDSGGLSPASNAELDSLMSDTSLAAVFVVSNRHIQVDNTSFAVNAPFLFESNDANSNSDGFCIKSTAGGSVTYTFSDMEFRGTLNLQDPVNAFSVAGNIVLTGPFTLMARGGTSGDSDNVTFTSMIDGSRIDTYRCQWRYGTVSKPGSNLSRPHLANGNNAFFGEWILSTRLIADVDGALGDADVTVLGATDMTVSRTDPNLAPYKSGKNQGILWLKSNASISPTAKLTLGASSSTVENLPGKVVIDSGVNVQVRQLLIDGSPMAAATYGSADIPGRIEGLGTITVADVNATAVLTMACTLGDGGPAITGDTALMPRVGDKGYKPGYVARIRAKSTLSVNNVNYLFAHWTGTGIANLNATDTTVTMDASKTVTAVYTQSPGASVPVPANRAGPISVTTGLSWNPDAAAGPSSVQEVYFGRSQSSLAKVATLVGTSVNSVTNAQLGGALVDQTNYYWRIVTDGAPGTTWVFTTGPTRTTTPFPATGAMDQVVDPNLSWVSPDAATSYDVYFSTSKSAVENGLVTPVNVTTRYLAWTGLSRGMWYYWRVDARFPGKTTVGDVWSFRVNAVKLTFDTTLLTVRDEGGALLSGVTSFLDDDSVAVFKFDSFTYGQEYDFVVTGANKLAIWSDSSMSLGGVISVSAPSNGTTASGAAIAGGFIGGPGVIQQTDATQPNYTATPILFNGVPRQCNYHWFQGDMNYYRDQHPGDANYKPLTTDQVYGPGRPYAQYNYVATTDGQYPKWAKDSRSGTGGTYGGHGGNSTKTVIGAPGGHAATYAVSALRYDASTQNLPGYYGQRELYELWGGSGGDGGFVSLNTAANANALGGAAGGGVVEIFTKGNLTIGPNAQILSNGGNSTVATANNTTQRAGGAGSGGSVRIIAAGSVTLSGKLAAEGGRGASTTATSNYSSPGGGGGRIAIYKGGTLNSAGAVVTVAGGASGTHTAQAANAFAWQSGTSGTVFGMQAGEGAVSMVTSATLPIPADGTRGIAAGTADLTWLPGVGSTANEVYFGTTSTPPLLTTVTDPDGRYLRARKSVSAPVVLNAKYYWRIKSNGVMGPLWMFRTVGWEAKNPTPAQAATGVTTSGLNLMWQDGYDPNYVTSRDVFFGTDQTAVANAVKPGPLYLTTVTDKNNLSVALPTLLANKTYYWRVDTYFSVAPSYVDGLVWNFTTRQPLCLGVLSGDFNNDCKISFADFALFAANYGRQGSTGGVSQ